MQRFAGGREHGKDSGERLGILAAQDVRQGFALCRRGPFVDDVNAFALTLVNRAWPAENSGGSEPVEPGGPVETCFDVVDRQTAAVAVGRKRIELARAAIIAIAIAE